MPQVPTVIRELCTGCDVCVELCPDVFQLDDELVAEIANPFGDSIETIQEAIDLCPESCIKWRETAS